MAHEELGMGVWSKCTEDVPVTRRGETLGVLRVGEKEHPRLTVLERERGDVELSDLSDRKGKMMMMAEVKGKSESESSSIARVRRVETALSSTSTAV
jgi:hypothetical protein